jgi:hypothetical protein
MAIEAYGNRINKGKNTKDDVKAAIFSLSKDEFSRIFHSPSSIRSRSLKGTFLNKALTQAELSSQISAIRNHFVHPFIDGSEKKPIKVNIHKKFIHNDRLNYSRIKLLSEKIHNCIHFLLLKEIGLESFWK